jgi:hypothetical protein
MFVPLWFLRTFGMTGLITDLVVHYFANEGSLLERELDLDLPLAMAGDPLQVLQIIAHTMFFLTFFYLIFKREPRARIQRVPESRARHGWDGQGEIAKRVLALEQRVQALALQNSFGEPDQIIEPEPGFIQDPDPLFAPLRTSISEDQGPEPGTQSYPVPTLLQDAPRPQTPARRRDYHGAGLAQADDSEGNREAPSNGATAGPREAFSRRPSRAMRNRVDLLRQAIRRARLEVRGPTPLWFWYGLLFLTAAIFSIGFVLERIA